MQAHRVTGGRGQCGRQPSTPRRPQRDGSVRRPPRSIRGWRPRELTGNGSKGNGGHYWYYHCHHCHGQRFRADDANVEVVRYLNEIAVAPEVAVLYGDILEDLARDEKTARARKVARLRQEIAALEEKLFKVDEAFIEGQIAPGSYGRLKGKYQDTLNRLRFELETLTAMSESFADQLNFAIKLLSNLGTVYRQAEFRAKHRLLGSIFPQKQRR